jgi:hypothetical protein
MAGDSVPAIDTNRARSVLAKTNWEKRREVATMYRHRVYTHDCLPLGFFYISHATELIVMGTDSYQALATDSAAFGGIVKELSDGGGGLIYIDLANGEFAETLRERARESGTASVKPKDILSDMLDRAQSLMVKAQSLRRSATREELTMFTAEVMKLRLEVQDAATRIGKLEIMLELATDTALAA